LFSIVEQTRLRVSKSTDAKKKSQLGQFFTPGSTAKFMASLFTETVGGECRLLDAGAGIGSLSCAFLQRCHASTFCFDKIDLTAYELDEVLHQELIHSLSGFTDVMPLSFKVIAGDFIEAGVNEIQFWRHTFTHAILNPPYKKISSHSHYRLLLREVEIETVNLYSAFVALTLLLMAPGGQIVAIIPRSFCNGPYYRPFRDHLLKHAAIRHLHLFESRSKAFKDDDVLQENIIIRLERSSQQGPVSVSTSTDDSFSDIKYHEHAFDRIVFPDDKERFIHIPTSPDKNMVDRCPAIHHSLADLGLSVSTGPVVDFRLKAHLRNMPEPGTVPLLYPIHFGSTGTDWPKPDSKKPNAIQRNPETEKWLFPKGTYCIVRRFSSKEEKRRIVASVVDQAKFPTETMLGFENHLNVFHINKNGLPKALANGLAVFLSTTAVDENFRRFNGHTQVNATDLKQMKYLSRDALIELGEWAMNAGPLTQAMIDEKFARMTE